MHRGILSVVYVTFVEIKWLSVNATLIISLCLQTIMSNIQEGIAREHPVSLLKYIKSENGILIILLGMDITTVMSAKC